MSEIKGDLELDDWVKNRMQKLQRIDYRITENLRKYRQRKSQDLRRSQEGQEKQSSVEHIKSSPLERPDENESFEKERVDYDEIADDWRKLRDTITSELPVYIKQSSSSKAINKINTIRQQSQRVAKKIEIRLEQSDLKEYRYKQGLKKWQKNVAQSLIRTPRPPPPQQYQEIVNEAQKEGGSAILSHLNSMGSERLKQLQEQMEINQKLVDQYEQEKQEERLATKVLLGSIVVMLLIAWMDVQVNTGLFWKIISLLGDDSQPL